MPPLTTDSARELVSGGALRKDIDMQTTPAAQPQTLWGVVERAFYFQGKPLEKGKKCELPRLFALEMQAAKKFTLSTEPAAAEPPKADVRQRKGEKDVG